MRKCIKKKEITVYTKRVTRHKNTNAAELKKKNTIY